MSKIRTILHATDFSEPSNHALDYAVRLARRLEAQLTVMHVYQSPVYALPDGALVPTPELLAELSDKAQQELNAVRDRLKETGVEVETRLVQGVAHQEISRVADELNADLVVLGTHGRTGLSRFLIGSVAERAVRTCAHPVLTVPLDAAPLDP